MLKEIFIRFLIGGAVVSVFAVLGDTFKPKSFAGLFGAAPSVALATLTLVVLKQGKLYAATEAKFMMAGALAFMVYSGFISWSFMRCKWPVMVVTILAMPVWFGVALGFWSLMSSLLPASLASLFWPWRGVQ
ncbi:MAG TPA: DUF3147 family protein [Terriglobales bacterium]|nr:DUF3147 family protein [Terriglobales bacterium]